MADARKALRVLLDLTRELSRERSLETALQLVTDAALEILPGEHSSVRLLDDSGSQLLSGARSGEATESTRPVHWKPGEGVGGWVVLRNRSVRIMDTADDSRFVVRPGQGLTIGSMVAVPMRSGERVIGVLTVTAPRAHSYSEDHEVLAQLLANCAVPPIERARLARLAVTDSHTLAYNRRHLKPRLTEEMERCRRHEQQLSLLMMDLDHFKRVNDQHGHNAGDIVLREFADRTRDTVRRYDILVRRGGEEFVLIMPDTALDEALQVAERIRSSLEERPVSIDDGKTLDQTVSIGAACWDGLELPGELEERADKAMYRAKESGRNRVIAAGG